MSELDTFPELKDLAEHCSALSMFFKHLWLVAEGSRSASGRKGEELSWINVSDWLKIAASITTTKVDTARFDPYIYICYGVRVRRLP